MLKIYGALNSRASRPIWLALELGLAFEHIPVIQASRLTDPGAPDAPLSTASPAFRAITPAGLIPAIDDDGLIVTESLAINLHLARTRGGPLAARDAAEDAHIVMHTLWAATACEPHGIAIIVNRAIRGPEERDDAALAAAIAGLEAPLLSLAAALEAGGGHLVGGRFTVADLNVAEVLRYAQPATELMARHPVVAAWLARCQARPAFQEMTARRAAEWLPEGWRAAYRPGR